jgi:hypothetical protein
VIGSVTALAKIVWMCDVGVEGGREEASKEDAARDSDWKRVL